MVFGTGIDRTTYNVRMKYQGVRVKADLLRMCQSWRFFHTNSYNAVISLSRERYTVQPYNLACDNVLIDGICL